jgi:hypothetical protein
MMKTLLPLTSAAATVIMLVALSSCSSQDDMAKKPEPKPAVTPATKAPDAAPAAKAETPAKAKATKVAGDVGLIDTEKNYMIIVTKEGKLLTVDFDPKTKATQVTPTPGKIADVGLGSTATVTYTQDKGKNVANSIEYRPAKGE